jgi:hypothetical protein
MLVYFMSIWFILHPLGMFYVQLVYFTAIGHILWTFGKASGYLVYFSPFWYVEATNIWQPRVSLVKNILQGAFSQHPALVFLKAQQRD